MKRSEDRILTTHVGSLIRPPELLQLSAGAKDGAGRQRYEEHLEQSVADIVRMQAKAGIDVVNDGEFGKSGWANYALGRVSGFEERPKEMYPAVWLGRDRIRFADFMAKEFPRGVTRHARPCLRRPDRLPGPRQHRARYPQPDRGGQVRRRGGGVPGRRGAGQQRRTTGSTNTTRVRKSTSTPSPMRCGRSTARSSMLACWSRSTTRSWPTCTTIWSRPARSISLKWAQSFGSMRLNHALEGNPRGPGALPRLFRKLARPARRRRAARRR